MADKILEEFSAMDDIVGGNIYFGCAESYQIRHLARVIKRFKEQYPDFHYHITSGDTEQVTEKLDKGILDFAVIVEEPDYEKYNVLKMPGGDRWGVIMPSDSPLAQKEQITFDDLKGLPLFCSEQSWRADLPRWCQNRMDELRLEGSFRLSYNGSVFAREGLGYLLTFDHLIDTSEKSGLVFRPLFPVLKRNVYYLEETAAVYSHCRTIYCRIAKFLPPAFLILQFKIQRCLFQIFFACACLLWNSSFICFVFSIAFSN